MRFPILLTALFLLGDTGFVAEEIDFNRDIRPILSDRCFHCHGPDAENQKSDYRVDTEENSRADLGSDLFGIVPGNLKKSELHWRIRSDDSSEQMPPPDSNRVLSDREKDLLDQWIKEGAKYEGHWAFDSVPKSVSVPEMKSDPTWAKNKIDAFIARGHEKAKISPADPVSREKWLRRVTFDLTGLPPTLEEIDGFLADDSKDAEAKVIDALFETSAYAERMTSEWMDVARYSDSYGYQVDRDRFVWPWRDWVLKAFRENLSYDQFITWQLAGDLLPNATRDQILATTFNRLHPQKVEGGSVPEEFRMEYVTDRLHTFGTAFLGLTMECCRCHDHKYDPLPTKEYYQLSSYFANIDEAGLYSYFTPSIPTPTLPLPTADQEKKLVEAEVAVKEAEEALAQVESEVKTKFTEWKKNRPAEMKEWPGLIAKLDFEKFEKGKITDLAQSEKPASTGGGNKQIEGKVGQGFHLTGDDAIRLNGGNFSREQPFSIALWLRPEKITERQLVIRRSKAWTDAASRGFELMLLEGHLSFGLVHFEPGNSIRVRSPKPLNAREWVHVAVSYDGSSRAAGMSIHLNGKRLEAEVVRDQLTRAIRGGGDDFIAIGQRMRDKGFKNGAVDEFHVFDRVISAAEAAELHQPGSFAKVDDEKLSTHFLTRNEERSKALKAVEKARAHRNGIENGIKEIMVMKEMEKPKPAFVLTRGAYDQIGESVTAGVPEVLSDFPAGAPNNRLGLAQWLVADEQPLTARVTVNRYWQMMFGHGLVRTPEDFGLQSAPPTHPDLLDWLARDFMDHGWDVRRLLKQMALSATYCQSTVVPKEIRDRDPENVHLARSNGDRLAAEMIRDNVLALSGLLDSTYGGGSAHPYDLAVSFKPAKPGNVYRRSLYTYWRRTGPAPVMMALDASKRDVCRVRREATASPIQALVLLNGPQFVEASRALAGKLITSHGEGKDEALLEEAFRLLTSRAPEEKEQAILKQLLDEQRKSFGEDPEAAASYLTVGKAPAPKDVDPVELAAVTVLVNSLMNLDECVTRR